MGLFLTNLECEILPFKRETIQLTAPLVFAASDGRFITGPTGFISDGVSGPQPFWPIASPLGINARAGVNHDVLYTNKETRQAVGMRCDFATGKVIYPPGDPAFWLYQTLPCNQEQADNYFLEMSEACGSNQTLAHIEWGVLRLFGWTHWNRATAELARAAA